MTVAALFNKACGGPPGKVRPAAALRGQGSWTPEELAAAAAANC